MLTMWHPLVDTLFAPRPLQQRWRLLLFLPLTLLLYPLKSIPYLLSRPFVTYHIPTRRPDESLRALVYNHPSRCGKLKRKRPLHIDVHAGGFVGGIPEADAPFCTKLAESTGAVVVSVTYRFAPRYPFPAAPDDIADALAWLVEHAGAEFEADTEIVTFSGFSAGGTVALGGTLGAKDTKGRNRIKGSVTFYSLVSAKIAFAGFFGLLRLTRFSSRSIFVFHQRKSAGHLVSPRSILRGTCSPSSMLIRHRVVCAT